MPEIVLASPESSRRRAVRATALASSGLLVGFGATAAAPALAATPTDCDGSNTVDAATQGQVDIQNLLDANTAIVCLSGTFPLTSPLTFDHDLTLFGLSDAVLDGGLATGLLVGSGAAGLTVQNITFTDGSAVDGGAILSDGRLIVEDSTFSGNQAQQRGGAIFNVDGSYNVEIRDSVFTSNDAVDYGGAVYADVVLIESSTFTDNTAQAGGAVYGGVLATLASTFTENSALGGGGVWSWSYGASAGSTFVDNQAVAGGGFASYGATLVVNSTFMSNDAEAVGGAVLANYGLVQLSTFLENRAGADVAEDQSEAIFSIGTDQSVAIGGNIFAGSRTVPQLGSDDPDMFDDRGGNVFSTTAAQEAALVAPDPSSLFGRSVTSIFGPSPTLGDNGGPTPTLALVSGSPAIDAVPEGALDDTIFVTNATLAPAIDRLGEFDGLLSTVTSITVDQRNLERTGLLDAGAFEFGDAELAATGADSGLTGWLAGGAALLVGLGVAGLALSRRSRRR